MEQSRLPSRTASVPRWTRLVTLASLAVSASACSNTGIARRGGEADTLWVGVAVGLTSPGRYVNVFEGVQMALDQLNRQRPSGAATLAMRRAPTTARSAVDIASAFRDDPDVIGVVGHTESAATISAAAIYADRANGGRNAIAAVSPTAGAPAVTRASDWVFRVCPTSSEQARALARYLIDTLHVRRTAVLYRNDPSGTDVLRAFSAEYQARGGTVTERDPFTEDIAEFDAYSRRITASGATGAVVAGNTTEERPFLRALHRTGGSPAVLGTNPPEVGDSASEHELRGMRFVQLFSAEHPPTENGARFVEAFHKRTGRTADRWGALGYDAAMLIGQAAQSAGRDRRAIRDWIAAVGRSRPAYSGATGPIAFDAQRDPVNKFLRVSEAGR